MAKKVNGERTRGRELAKDNAALAKAYNVSKSTTRDTFVSIFMSSKNITIEQLMILR